MAVDSRFGEFHAFIDELLVDERPSMLGSTPYPVFSVDEFLVEPSSQNLAFPTDNGVDHVAVPSWVPPVNGGGGGSGEAEVERLCFPSGRGSSSERLFADPGMTRGKSLSPGAELSSLFSDDGNDSLEAVLKYINQILMDEDMEETPWFFSNQVALLDTEKSLYDALGRENPGLPTQSSDVDVGHVLECPSGDDRNSWVSGISIGSSQSVDPNYMHRGKSIQRNTEVSPSLLSHSVGNGNGSLSSDATELSISCIFRDRDSVEQFRKGLEEASKFLPSTQQLFKNIDSMNFVHDESSVPRACVYKELRTHTRDDKWADEGRAKKQTAVSIDEVELTEMFDRVLLYNPEESSDDNFKESDSSKGIQTQGRRHKGGKSHGKKHNNRKNTVDLRSLLVLCAQAYSGRDSRTANELLKKIRENSTPLGDGSQRLAHYFANALEARMDGNGCQMASFFASPTFKKTSAAVMLKAYHALLTACPFLKFSIYFGGYMINGRAGNTGAVHIIDFGIGLGFHWPILIQMLSERPGGPPRLRMTGIEFPVPGFRPAQRMEDTFRRLAKYCERFGVPFEYAAIPSADWSSIRIEDLKLRSDEMIAVCSIDRLKNLLDETVEEDIRPRDTVLDLIRGINPDIFVHSTASGSYTAPFFVTRFRELLFHQSAMFNMFDTTLPSDSREREVIERELLGREIMNVVACEGAERIERPETHKQWQARLVRAGFRAIPVDEELMKGMRSRMRAWYHKDFVLDVDRDWMLLGWRGRIMSCSSCWVPN